MENSRVRPQSTRCPFHGERKDGLHIQNRFCDSARRHSPPPSRNRRYRALAHREACQHVTEVLGGINTESSNKFSTHPLRHSPVGNLADGYAHASSQLRLYPGSLATFYKSVAEVPCWSLVAEVCVMSDSNIKCPICLGSPVSPRMERCGHLYCGPCVVQYVRYENTCTSKKCAVCSWVMNLEDLKRVELLCVEALKVGSSLDMTLLKRPKACSCSPLKEVTIRSLSTAESRAFQFVVEMSSEELASTYAKDQQSLISFRTSCFNDGDTVMLPHVSYLIDQLECEIKQLERISEISPLSFTEEPSLSPTLEDDYYFYQASDGRLIFLDGLMWSCLLREATAPTNLPAMLRVLVTSIRTQKMSLTSRKRWRHLSHIPLGHTIIFVEIELKSLVSQRVLEEFAAPLEIRFLERDRQRLEDLKLTKLKEAAENQIPSLPPGFVLSGRAELPDYPTQQPRTSDFMPLCSVPAYENRVKFSSSFAEVTKLGARSIVDQNRVATFSKGPTSRTHKESFNPATEVWPSLCHSVKSDNRDTPDNFSPIQSTGLSSNIPSSVCSIQTCSRKHRKKHPDKTSN